MTETRDLKSQLEKINELTRKNLTEEEIYIFPVSLCDNEIDRDYERFTVAALRSLSKLFIGKTGIFDHSMMGKDQTARIFDASVEANPNRHNALGEVYHYLKGWAYMIRNDKNADLIAEIEGGIKKEVSVGCSVASKSCSICGKDLMQGYCMHQKGTQYGDKLCHTILDNPTDAYEWSFVAVPAQPSAGVVKSFALPKKDTAESFHVKSFVHSLKNIGNEQLTLSSTAASALYAYISDLEASAELAEEYRKDLTGDILRLSTPSPFSADFISKGMSLLSIPELKELRETLRQKNCGNNSFIQLYTPDRKQEDTDNSQFQI